nr:reverse transcriptase domain-containing protein [Tanacetum cinerariifolium]
MYTFIIFDLCMSSWVPIPLNAVGFSGCSDDTFGTRSSTSTGSVRTPRHLGVILNSECKRTPVRDVGQAVHSLCNLSASSSAGHTSKTGVIDVGSNSVNDGSNTRGSTSTGQPGHMVNGVTDDALRLYLFSHSLTHHATAWFDRLPRNAITTFEQMAKMFHRKYFPPSMVTKLRNEITNFCQRPDESLFEAWKHYKLSIDHCPNHNMLLVTQIDTFYNGLTLRHRDIINAAASGTFMKRRPEECYDLIENMTAHHNDWDTSVQRKINKNLMKVLQINQQVKAVAHNCETCGGPHSYNDCPATVGQTQNGNNQGRKQFFQGASHGQIPTPVYQAPAYQASGYQAPVHQALIPQLQVVTTAEFTNHMKANDAILKNMQTNMTLLTNSNLELKNMFGQFMKMNTASSSGSRTLPSNTITNSRPTFDCPNETPIPNSEPVVAPVVEPVVAPVSALKPNQKPSISYPSRRHDQKLHNKANDQKEKFFKIFQDLDFNISFADALILMPKFGQIIKSLLTNKEKLFELARTSLNEHSLAVLLKKLPEKLGDPGKFLIPCDFSRMEECLALADLDASINLIPLSVWNKLCLPKLSSTSMTLELADRSISRPVEVAEDVYIKVGTFHFLADFVVVEFDADLRVPLILERSFLKTRRALIDVYEGELTLRVGKEAVTFNLDQTLRYSANYDAMSVNRIDLIDVACEEYSQEVLGFFMSGNPTPSTEPIVSNSSPTFTPFRDSDFLLEETNAFLAIDDEPISSKINDCYYDSEGDILLLEEFLNDDPSSPPLPPQELKVVEPTHEKSSIDEPPVLELKDLPSHLEYAFLEGDDKLPVIITKDLKDKEKTALIKVLKSHKQALAWQLSDIKGINSEFYTHKILMEDDFKLAVQHQRRVDPKIHEVIKKEVLKLLEAGLIYLISDSPWLNDSTRKDHFPLPFMDQMLERLAGNEYYCFLSGFSGYFQIPIDSQDQEKTTFTCPYGTFAYLRMPFSLCVAPGTFQMCMMAIFHDMIENTMEVFMDDFSKSHFMVKEGIVLGHKISKNGIEVDKAKVNVIAKLPHPTTVKVYTDHSALRYLFNKQDAKPRLLRWVLLLQEFDFIVRDKKRSREPSHRPSVPIRESLPKFGTPRAIISDRSTHFCNDQLAKVMLKYGVTYRHATAYHPQTSGQVEVCNRGLKRILERTVGESHASWDWVKLSDLKQAVHGRNSWILKTRACGFVLRSPSLHILSFILGIQYLNLID